jgi:hypothetical protein
MSLSEPIPPHFGPEFLVWLRAATERAWESVTERTVDDYQRLGVGGTSWRRGTRWTGGLSDEEIDDAERRYGLRFPPDYRLFLRLLHATTPRCRGARFIDHETIGAVERPAFFDWRHDDAEIRDALSWPLEGLLFDVENNVLWQETWGARPDAPERRRARLETLLAGAPKLVPVTGHRYVVPVEPYVVLSVHQGDIIVYGSDLRAFLLAERVERMPCQARTTFSKRARARKCSRVTIAHATTRWQRSLASSRRRCALASASPR